MAAPADAFDVAAASALIDRVAAAFAEPPWEEEIGRARAEHDEARGKIFEDDEHYGQHMAAFLEWYVLERPLPAGRTPAAEVGAELAGEHRELLSALAGSQRGLFEVLRVRAATVRVVDLIRGGRWLVDWVAGRSVAPGDIFEARIVPWRGKVCFGPVVLFQPREARGAIDALLTAWAERAPLGPEHLGWLAEMRLRYSRFRNIAVEHIYRLDRTLG